MSDALQPTLCPFCKAASNWISTTVEKWDCGTIIDHARSRDDVLMRADQTYTCRKAELARLYQRIQRVENAMESLAIIVGPPGKETWATDAEIEAAWALYLQTKNAKP